MAALSLNKDKIRILLLEGVNDSAVALLREAGYSQITRHAKALDGAALTEDMAISEMRVGGEECGHRAREDIRVERPPPRRWRNGAVTTA